ncbi:MAG: HigA family addiction module antitoxin [Crocosphaera sp.]|nr:HigA family addiction module antitoxin [Crocosphaera sp.]
MNQIIEGKHSINAEIALRLSKYFGLSERFWLNLQVKYNIEITKDRL